MFINIDMSNKKTIDLSYSNIETRVRRSKLNEKKLITDFLKNMDDDERRVEDTKKILKLGRWNVGLRKGLVNYDKERYVEERNQLFEQLTNKADIENEGIVIQMDAQQSRHPFLCSAQHRWFQSSQPVLPTRKAGLCRG